MRSNATRIFHIHVCRHATKLGTHGKPFIRQKVALVRSIRAASSSSGRRQVTVANDDGRVDWGDLSVREKAARTTQQSFNLLVIVAGVIATGVVGYLLVRDVFSGDSKTAHFNRATDTLRRNPRCIELLGPPDKIEAFGEPSHSRWARNRFIRSVDETDKLGTHHMHMRFYVRGPLNKGTVYVNLAKRPSETEHTRVYMALEVNGHHRVVVEDLGKENKKKAGLRLFGVNWW